uniref:Uncharacterized protein n=1 Tax=Arundo donax TaxID=35708 RepID=A0A0A9EW16_ARUDO
MRNGRRPSTASPRMTEPAVLRAGTSSVGVIRALSPGVRCEVLRFMCSLSICREH